MQARIELMPKLRKRYHERIRKLDQEVTAHAVSVLLEEIKNRYQDLPDVLSYLDAVQQNIIENAGQFRETETPALVFPGHDSSRLFESYQVNLLVSNVTQTSAPIVYEPNPAPVPTP